MAVAPSAPLAPDLGATGAGELRRRAVRKACPQPSHDFGGTLRASQAGPALGLIAQVLLLAVLAGPAGLGAAGWVVGVACAVAMAAAFARGLRRGPGERLEPASWVTLARATLAVGVAALAADSL